MTTFESKYAWYHLFESLDPLLLVAELCALVLLWAHLSRPSLAPARASATRRLAVGCQRIGFSLAEVAALAGFAGSFLLFDLFTAFTEDDAAETFGFLFVSLVLAVSALAALFVNVHYYYMLSCVGGSEVTLRVLYADVVSNALCLLRIVFCWVRYVFYDLQSELIDFTAHYTDPDLGCAWAESTLATTRGVAGLEHLATDLALILLDLQLCVLQLFVGCFKLAIATFLFWLILDLFLLRPLAQAEALSLLRARRGG